MTLAQYETLIWLARTGPQPFNFGSTGSTFKALRSRGWIERTGQGNIHKITEQGALSLAKAMKEKRLSQEGRE